MSSSNKIKLELRTPLELFFLVMVGIFAFILVVATVGYLQDGVTAMAKILFIIGALGSCFFGGLYLNTDNYYILDTSTKVLLYHFKFFFIRKVSVFARFGDVCAVTVTGKFNRSKHATWWTYQVIAVKSDGKTFPLSNMAREAYSESLSLAGKIASVTGADLIESQPERVAEVVYTGKNRYSFKHMPFTWLDSMKETLLIIVVIMALIAILVTLATSQKPILNLIESLLR